MVLICSIEYQYSSFLCSGDGLKSRNDGLKTVIKNLEGQVLKEKEAKERLQRECADQWSQVSRLKAEVRNLVQNWELHNFFINFRKKKMVQK